MRFLKFKASNLFSLREVELNLEHQGLLLIHGKNGSGKSSLCNKSILWTLFGQTPGGLKADDVINLYGDTKKAYGQIEFIGNDSIHYQVTRSRSPGCLQFDDLSSGQDLTLRYEKETQALIDRALGRNYSTFIETDFFGQGKASSFFNLQTSHQLELLEKILPIEELTKYAQNAKDFLSLARQKASENATATAKLSGQIVAANNQAARLKVQFEQWEKDKINRLAKFNNLKEPEESKYWAEDIEENIKSCAEGEDYWKRELKLAQQNKEICLTCGQPFCKEDQEKIKLAENGIEQYRQTKDEWSKELTKAVAHERYQEQISQYEEINNSENPFALSLSQVNMDFTELETAVSNNKNDLKLIENEIELLTFWSNAFSKDFRNYLIQRACPFLTDRSNYYLSKLGNAKLQIEFDTITTLASGDSRHKFSVTAKNESGGNHYDALSGAEQQMCNFAVGLALSDLAQSQVGGSTNLMILDEPFVYMDNTNSENLVNFIRTELLSRKETIFLISNEEMLIDLIPNKLSVQKVGGITQVL